MPVDALRISYVACEYDYHIMCTTIFKFHSAAGLKHCHHQDIKLIGGNAYYAGRVQVCKRSNQPYFGDVGRWGNICRENWDSEAATVACKELGFTGGGMHVAKNIYNNVHFV